MKGPLSSISDSRYYEFDNDGEEDEDLSIPIFYCMEAKTLKNASCLVCLINEYLIVLK